MRWGAAALALIGIGWSAPSRAQGYPSKPIQLVVPLAAGGPADAMARALADKLSGSLKQTVLVVNQAGAGGNVGAKAVAQAQPDGHALLFALDVSLTANPALYGARMGFDPQKDLRPIATLMSYGQTLAVHPSLKVRTLNQFIELARQQPLNYGSAGNGSPGHLGMELFASLAKIKLSHIAYRGAAPALNDLVGGQIQAGLLVTPGVAPHAQSGRLVPLLVSSQHRSKMLPQVPTAAEAGLPSATLEFTMLLAAPAKTPDAVVQRLNEEVRRAMDSPEIQKLVTANDYTVVVDTPEQAAERLAATTKRMNDLIRSVGITVE